MGKVYQTVREVVQGSLNRTTPGPTVSSQATRNEDSLSEALEDLDKIFADGIRKLKAAVSDNRAVVLTKTKHAEQVIEGLKANITAVEARVRETEDTLHNQNIASQNTEESLRIEIGNLESALKEKEEALQSQKFEVNDLRSRINVMAEQVTELEQARRDTASKVQEADQVIEGLKTNIAGLETRLNETEDTVKKKDTALQNLEGKLTAEIRALQSLVREKDQALESREKEINNLTSKMDVIAEQISESELAVVKARGEAASKVQEAEQVIEGLKANIIVLEATLKAQLSEAEQIVGSTDLSVNGLDQERNTLIDHLPPQQTGTEAIAQAFANLQAQAMAKLAAGEPGEAVEEKSSTFQSEGIAPITPEAARKTVSPETFVRIVAEFSKFANVIDNIASLIVRHHVRTLGESMEEFPQKRLPELIESLSNEISHSELRTDFRERFASVTASE
jgi:predicted  nucleic acid-binding Zn-ribbon protein